MAPRRRRPRAAPLPPPPPRSARLYLKLARPNVALFRFLLEAHDNLAVFTVADPAAAILQVRFSPHQVRQVRDFLREITDLIPHEIVFCPENGQATP